MQAHQLAQLFEGHRFKVTSEAELQRALDELLRSNKCRFEREHELSPRNIVDFYLIEHSIAVEVKMRGSFAEVLRQLHRYAEHNVVHSLVLVTTRVQHRGMPTKMHGKPVHVVMLAGAFA